MQGSSVSARISTVTTSDQYPGFSERLGGFALGCLSGGCRAIGGRPLVHYCKTRNELMIWLKPRS